MTFNLPTPTPPAAVMLTSPNGSITTNNPTYTWNKVSAATWYYLYVSGPSGYVFTQWHLASNICSASTCSIANATTMAAGEHKWWVQTWNGTGGYGPWSTGMTFTVVAPAAATLTSPNGTTTNNPNYTWNKVNEATWYNLYVSGPSGYVFSEWYRASDVCDASTCSFAATPGLASGQYRWWIQTWNNVGYGSWSSGLNFTIVSNCSPAYPGVCIPPPPPDLNCEHILYTNFTVLPPDPHNFDSDSDGIGCEK